MRVTLYAIRHFNPSRRTRSHPFDATLYALDRPAQKKDKNLNRLQRVPTFYPLPVEVFRPNLYGSAIFRTTCRD